MTRSESLHAGELFVEITTDDGERIVAQYLRSAGTVTGPVRLVWVCAHEDGTELVVEPDWFHGAGEGVLFRI